MGLANNLDHHLDYIESNAGIQNLQDTVRENIMIINNICLTAFREAKDYLERNSPDSNNRSVNRTF
jgi:hypothetical protein